MAHTVCGSGSVKWAERVFIALLALPVIGLIWQGAGGVSGQPIQAGLRYLAQEPALFQSITLTLCVAAGSVMLSLWATAWLTFRVVSASQSDRFLSLTLAIPHSALALGVLLFFGASGVLVRWLLSGSAEVTLPDYLFPKDRYGLGVLLVLVLKESAFLTLLAIPLARRLPLQASFHMTRECGWSDWQAWRRLVWPQVRRMLRAPILVVFAFSLANLEIALVLGSDQTPFVAVRMLRWLTDPSPVAQQAGAIAILALLLVLVFISLFWFRLDRALSMQLPSKVTALQSWHYFLCWFLFPYFGSDWTALFRCNCLPRSPRLLNTCGRFQSRDGCFCVVLWWRYYCGLLLAFGRWTQLGQQ